MIYYPYFRGRQFDLRALTEFAEHAATPQIVPIIEPVRDAPALPKTITAFSQHHQRLAIIQNPQVDHYQAAKRYPIDDLMQSPEIQRAYILTPLLPPDLLGNSLVIVQHYADLKLFLEHDWLPDSATLLVPPEARIRQLLSGRMFGHLFDHYTVPEHSFDFAQMPDSFWSDDITFATQYGEIGFSDYLTQGAAYFERGHPSRTVTLHLIYLKDNQVRICHFVSDQHEDFKHQREKYFEALTKAVGWIKTQPAENQTTATAKLVTLAEKHHFPGMGVLKALTIEHHLEIMTRYLESN
ncbi:sce7725 family protein [Lactobacillus sp. LC28-10]|uniref:Sce7725 family protein n=1 Tax=Secundilactobacillus angelensis TaxID=2722706 RepID=A0ABX1KX19_9LACO|nr:sce7725 family protein [Secundilactobacillus angelensis]MCH5462364.1 sce7725 family protein [Secundilactobacillus angelensis]NLR18154.1 sce7725 family protein [Secundilactobacillus angelensis]